MLDVKLTEKEKAVLFYELFNMQYINQLEDEDDEEFYLLFDEEGEEYEGNFDFETLRDFFEFAIKQAKQEGKSELQYNMKKLLSL
jgi:hypothetical protein